MKNIPFIRKLKHIQKQYQRDLVDIAPYLSKQPAIIKLLGNLREMGLDLKYNYQFWGIISLSNILTNHGGYEKQRRFSKLCRRLGSAAKKQGKLVYIEDILRFSKGLYGFNHLTGKYSSDAREIPFHLEKKPYKVTMRFIEEIERTVWAESEDLAKEEVHTSSYNHKKDFKVEVRCQKIG
jgi:hypothetical protein